MDSFPSQIQGFTREEKGASVVNPPSEPHRRQPYTSNSNESVRPSPPPSVIHSSNVPSMDSTITQTLLDGERCPRAEVLPRATNNEWRPFNFANVTHRRTGQEVSVMITDSDVAHHLGVRTQSVIGRTMTFDGDYEQVDLADYSGIKETGMDQEDEDEVLGESLGQTWENNLPTYRADIGEEPVSFCSTELIWHIFFGVCCYGIIVTLTIFFVFFVNY